MAGVINPLMCNLSISHSAISYNLNNLTKAGIYNFVDTSNSVSNNPGVKYGMIIVFVAEHSYTAQLALDGSKLWYRFMNPSQSQYNQWVTII